MTSYSQSTYYYNNENDALSYNSQPISHNKRSNNGGHLDMYDRYGNIGLGSDLGALNGVVYANGTCSYTSTTPAAVTTAAAVGYSDHHGNTTTGASATPYRANDIGMQYDAGDSKCEDYGDKVYYETDTGCYDYWDDADGDGGVWGGGDDGRHTSLATTKMLPKLPIKHSSSMLDGMYISHHRHHYHHQQQQQQQRHGASLPTTPPVTNKKSRMLPQPVAASNTGGYSAYGAHTYGFQHQSKNNSSSSNNSSHRSAFVGGVGGLIGKCLPVIPLRMQSHPSYKSDSVGFLSDVAVPADSSGEENGDTTKPGGHFYDNTTINDYQAAIKSSPFYSCESSMAAIGNSSMQQQRPHTSLAPLNYNDDCNYVYNSADSLSTYSEPTAMTQAQQLQLQETQQQRKSSIIMAMTTASVIASGETRFTPNQITNNQSERPERSSDISSSKGYRSSSFEYDCTGVAVPKRELFDPLNTTTDDYFYDRGSLRNIGGGSPYGTPTPMPMRLSHSQAPTTIALPTTTTTNMPSMSLSTTAITTIITTTGISMLTSCGIAATSNQTTTTSATTNSRILPKRLPTPNNLARTTTTTIITSTTLATTANSSNHISSINNIKNINTYNNNNHNSSNVSSSSCTSSIKQLPKLPQSKEVATSVEITAAATKNTIDASDSVANVRISDSITSRTDTYLESRTTSTTLSSLLSTTNKIIYHPSNDTPTTTSTTYVDISQSLLSSLTTPQTPVMASSVFLSNDRSSIFSPPNDNSPTYLNNLKNYETPTTTTAVVVGADVNTTNNNYNNNNSLNGDKIAIASTNTSISVTQSKDFTAISTAINNIITTTITKTTCTTISTTATTTASTTGVDYSNYLKAYTLPNFSAYISNIGRTNEIKSTYQSLASTSTSSELAFPHYAQTYRSNCEIEPSTSYTTMTTPLKSAPPSANNDSSELIKLTSQKSLDKTAAHCSDDRYTETFQFKPTSGTATDITTFTPFESAVDGFANEKKNNDYDIDFIGTYSMESTTGSYSSLGVQGKFSGETAQEQLHLASGLKYPLDIITTTTIETPNKSVVAATTTTTYGVNLFTTTITSANVAKDTSIDSLSTANSSMLVTDGITTTVQPSTTTITTTTPMFLNLDVSSYEEYMKKFDLSPYASPVSYDTTTIEGTTGGATAATTTTTISSTIASSQMNTNPQYTNLLATNYNLKSFSTHPTKSTAIVIDGDSFGGTTTLAKSSEPSREVQSSVQYGSDLLGNYMNSFSTVDFLSTYGVAASDTPLTSTTKVADDTATTVSAVFDDNFYDSYEVDLGKLTTCTTALVDDAATVGTNTMTNTGYTNGYSYLSNTPAMGSYFIDYDTISAPPLTTEEVGDTYDDAHGGTLVHQPEAKLPSESATSGAAAAAEASQKTVAVTAAAAGKASSMFGGLSKGIKGGLDGVLSGVSGVSADVNKQKQSPSKKGFGFGLASKLMPNVGGILQNATNIKQSGAATMAGSTKATTPVPTMSAATTSAAYSELHLRTPSTELDVMVCEWSSMQVGQPDPLYIMNKSHHMLDYDTSSSSHYNNNDNIMSTHDGAMYDVIYHDEEHEHHHGGFSGERDQAEDDHDAALNLNPTKIVDYSTDYKYGYDEYGYSESDYIATGDIMEKSTYNNAYQMAKNEASRMAMGLQTTEAATSTWTTSTMGSSMAVTNSSSGTGSNSAESGGGLASSLLSSLTSAATQVQAQQPPATKSTSSRRSGGGMFGSFLGKAAAAVQSATQVVNQGASIASAAVQKGSAERPMTTVSASLVPKSIPSYSPSSGEDYENCNMIGTTTTISTITSPSITNNRNNNYGNNYYAEAEDQRDQILPTVPPAASTGKKLPTINGKSGFLIKQQPTEIFDDDDDDVVEVDENDVISDYDVGVDDSNFPMDSEQDDYYMDQQQTTPLSRGSSTMDIAMATNGYYEHTNGGYNYREDYFNEEDEYKYLEKEQKAQEALLMQQSQHLHTKTLLHQHQKQPPLEYIEETRDDYIDDNYPSEDSGNYLDESSSGSGGGCGVIGNGGSSGPISNKIKPPSAVPTFAEDTNSVCHQQIKKQDSIILEEDEDDLLGLDGSADCLDDSAGIGVVEGMAKATLSRKSSDILLDADQMTELPNILPKKKVLMRGETEEVVGGHIQVLRKPEVTAKQRWHWAYNKIIMQLNVSTDIS